MDDKIKKEIESATFERLLSHLDERKDVKRSKIEWKWLAVSSFGVVWTSGGY